MKFKALLKKLLLASTLLIVGFLAFVLFETKDDINADLGNIEEKLNRYYNPDKMGGFAVSVFNADSTIFSKGFGYSNKEDSTPYTTETQQYIASVSKTTIGIALLKAEELGLLTIDDPINKHLPFKVYNPNFPLDEITIKQLATHTSSLGYNEPVVESNFIDESRKEESLSTFMRGYFQEAKYGDVTYTNYRPGVDWEYSNIGSSLAAYIIEVVSGVPFSDFTQTHIFGPLNLNDTYWNSLDGDSLLHTKYYEPTTDAIINVESRGIIMYPARDMITSIKDLTTYCQAIIAKDPELLQSKSYDKLLSPKLNSSVTHLEDDNNGVFFFIDRGNYGINYQLTGMDGGDHCIKTMMWFDPKTELGYIFLGNTGPAELNRLHHILIYNSLVSLGHNYTYENSTTSEKIGLKWHNVYNRVRAIF
ncbi:MAG: serine hydrolase domain-containing protein [Saprospiraceae bacterium]